MVNFLNRRTPPPPVHLMNGMIRKTGHVELIISDHCNISCRQCNHGSPQVAKWNVDPADARADLRLLAKVYRCDELRLIGGEPLLHPRLTEVIAAGRESGISNYLKLVSNGTLISRLEDAAWALLDCVEISRYPGVEMKGMDEAGLREKGRQFNTKVVLADYPNFRETFTRQPNGDPVLVEQIFKACKIGTLWHCHALYKGRLYRCPQSIYVKDLAARAIQEGFPLRDGPDLASALFSFLTASEPLASCAHCVGTCGRKFPHRLMTRKEWADDLARPVDELLDRDLLAKALVSQHRMDDCRMVSDVGSPALSLWARVARRLAIFPR